MNRNFGRFGLVAACFSLWETSQGPFFGAPQEVRDLESSEVTADPGGLRSAALRRFSRNTADAHFVMIVRHGKGCQE